MSDKPSTAVFCGHGCACLTDCGDYYDSHGLEKPPSAEHFAITIHEMFELQRIASTLRAREANGPLLRACDILLGFVCGMAVVALLL